MRGWIICLFVILSTSGCATIGSLQPGTGGSTFEVRGKNYDEIWKAVVRTASRSLTIVESDKEAGNLKAEKGTGVTTWGEVVGIFVRPAKNGAPMYSVEVQSLKRSRLQITGQDWTSTMVSGIKAELEGDRNVHFVSKPDPSAKKDKEVAEEAALLEDVKKGENSGSHTPEKNTGGGFRDLAWGTNLSDVKGLEYVVTSGDTEIYIRPSDVMKIGGAELKRITYGFWKGKFFAVTIDVEGLANYEALKKSTFKRFGEGRKTNRFMENYIWPRDKNTMMSLEYKKILRKGILYMQSKALNEVIKASEDKDAEKGAEAGF